MSAELTTLLSVLVTFAGAAAVFTRSSAAEKAVFVKMVQNQNEEVSVLKAELAALRKNYEVEVLRGNRLEDEVQRLTREVSKRDDRIRELEHRLAETEARLATQESKIAKGE